MEWLEQRVREFPALLDKSMADQRREIYCDLAEREDDYNRRKAKMQRKCIKINVEYTKHRMDKAEVKEKMINHNKIVEELDSLRGERLAQTSTIESLCGLEAWKR